MNVKFYVRALLCLYLTYLFSILHLSAQTPQKDSPPDPVVALKVGDTLPPELWNLPLEVVNHPEGKKTITLNEYKDKLIILDFWATWCGTCIKGFPKINDLQTQWGDKIRILNVTYENQNIIDRFFSQGAGKSHPYILSVINNTWLKQYFPYFGLPHLVWIDPEGKVLNTTGANQLSSENIEAILGHNRPKMITKTDLDRKKPLFLSEQFGEDMELKSYSIFAKGVYPGLPHAHYLKKTAEGKLYGRQMTNLSMIEILHPIADELFQEKGDAFNSKRLKTAMDSTALKRFYPEGKDRYTYELIVPEHKADSLYHYMLADLNKYSDYSVTMEKIPTDCLILIRTSEEDKLQSKGGPPRSRFSKPVSILCNNSMKFMVALLNDIFPADPVIIDETGYTGKVDIEIKGTTNLAELRKELRRYDLGLVQVRRDLNTLVVRHKM
ncbi:MAG: TlpA family protein disulfide reductase [Leadbetterella sp.]|nr:TlpA family protein disulfide reductase [Leadbetterella sp.]